MSLANAFGDTVTIQPSATTSGLGDLALAAAKLAGSYIQTNGSQSVSSGFSGFGTHRITIAPVLSQSLLIGNCFWGPNHACAGGLKLALILGVV